MEFQMGLAFSICNTRNRFLAAIVQDHRRGESESRQILISLPFANALVKLAPFFRFHGDVVGGKLGS